MLRIDAYTTTEGLYVGVVGHCNGKRHGGERCETLGVSQLVPTHHIESYGLATAMVLTVDRLMSKAPRLEELALC